jgi:hypothetical protein
MRMNVAIVPSRSQGLCMHINVHVRAARRHVHALLTMRRAMHLTSTTTHSVNDATTMHSEKDSNAATDCDAQQNAVPISTYPIGLHTVRAVDHDLQGDTNTRCMLIQAALHLTRQQPCDPQKLRTTVYPVYQKLAHCSCGTSLLECRNGVCASVVEYARRETSFSV